MGCGASPGTVRYATSQDTVVAFKTMDPPDMAMSSTAPSSTYQEMDCELLGLSIAHLQSDFLAEIEATFGGEADPDYYSISRKMLRGPEGKGFGKPCPQDGQLNCSYVDAVDPGCTGKATVVLSVPWQTTARVVISSLSSWCTQTKRDPSQVFVWQCALCCNQYRMDDPKESDNPRQFDNFRTTLENNIRAVGHVLVLLTPWSKPTCIDRGWSAWELYTASRTKGCQIEAIFPQEDRDDLQAAMERDGAWSILEVIGGFRIQKAKTSMPHDHQNILQLIDPDASDHNRSHKCCLFNHQVAGQVQRWLADLVAEDAQGQSFAGNLRSLTTFVNAIEMLRCGSAWCRAAEVYRDGVRLAKKSDALGTSGYARLLHAMADCLAAEGKHAEAMALYQEAKAICDRISATDTSDYAVLLQTMGIQLGTSGHNEAAMECYEASRAVFEALGSTATPHFAGLLRSTGACLYKQGRSEEAMKVYMEAKLAYEAAGVKKTAENAELLKALGLCAGSLNQHDEAIAFYQEGQAVYETIGKTSTLGYASLLKNMAMRLMSKGQGKDALVVFEKAKAAYHRADATNTVSYAGMLKSMGACMGTQGKSAEALVAYEDSKQAYIAASATKSVEYASLLRNMGVRCSTQGRRVEALALYQEAKATYEEMEMSATPNYASLLQSMCACLNGLGRTVEAQAMFEEAKAVSVKAGGSPTPKYVGLLRSMTTNLER